VASAVCELFKEKEWKNTDENQVARYFFDKFANQRNKFNFALKKTEKRGGKRKSGDKTDHSSIKRKQHRSASESSAQETSPARKSPRKDSKKAAQSKQKAELTASEDTNSSGEEEEEEESGDDNDGDDNSSAEEEVSDDEDKVRVKKSGGRKKQPRAEDEDSDEEEVTVKKSGGRKKKSRAEDEDSDEEEVTVKKSGGRKKEQRADTRVLTKITKAHKDLLKRKQIINIKIFLLILYTVTVTDALGVKALVDINKGDACVALCGELVGPEQESWGRNLQNQRVLIADQLRIDATGDINGRGHFVQDGFVAKNYNVSFDLNRPTTPDCLIGHALKKIKTGDYLYAPRGKSYWVQRSIMESLSPEDKAQCMRHFKVLDSELI
jgi:hypothetical protein